MIFTPPEAREDKPGFDTVPDDMRQRISAHMQDAVVSGETVYGGFSPTAGFKITLASGKKIFAKGNHPEEMSHGTATVRQEISIYQNVDILRKISPQGYGMVGDGDEDGWLLGLWEYIDPAPQEATVIQTIDALVSLQSGDASALEPAQSKNFIEMFLSPDRKWQRLRDEQKPRDKFLSMFEDIDAGTKWFDKNIGHLVTLQQSITDVTVPSGLLHGDLRRDNILLGKDGVVRVIDWPNACHGPLLFDAVFLAAHTASLELASFANFFSRYEAARGMSFVAADVDCMMAAIAGFFADQAYRNVPSRLPRLRWMQKSMLLSLLRGLSERESAGIDAPPRFVGQN